MGLFNVFIKKENKFLALLHRLVTRVVESSEVLVEFMNLQEGAERGALNVKIKEIESAGDVIYNEIFDELNKTFITPFDREDIQALAAKLDDVLDFIHGVAKRTMMYNLQELPAEFIAIAEIVRDQCKSLQSSMSVLGKVTKNPEAVKKECHWIHILETKADGVYAEFVTKLFATCKDPIEIIKLNGIIQYLEDTTDKTDEAADVIRTIIVKYN